MDFRQGIFFCLEVRFNFTENTEATKLPIKCVFGINLWLLPTAGFIMSHSYQQMIILKSTFPSNFNIIDFFLYFSHLRVNIAL